MAKLVLDVGQCAFDHGAIRRILEKNFHAQVVQIHTIESALKSLREKPCDLVLVNRIFDLDYSEGLELIRQMKGDSVLKDIPVMLVTNFPEHQKNAIEVGAIPGFGKNALSSPATVAALAAVLE